MILQDIIGAEVLLLSSQANWLQLEAKGSPIKVWYKGKVEYRLRKNSSGIFNLLSNHPLLLNHNESWQEVFLNDRPSDPVSFVAGISGAIEQILGTWRDWKHYVTKGALFKYADFERNVISGHGFIAYAPVSVAAAVIAFCKEQGIDAFLSESDYQRTQKRILLFGTDYIIAEEFSISNL